MSEEVETELEDDEKIVQVIKPSWKAYWFWILMAAVVAIGTVFVLSPISLVILAIIWLHVKMDDYTITDERLLIKHGLIARKVEEVELFRIKDVTVSQGVIGRILNVGSLKIHSVDATTPIITIKGIDNPLPIKEKLRKMYRASRKKERVMNAELLHSL